MRDNLAEQIELAVRRRAVKLPNVLPLATLFDPRLPGFTMPVQPALTHQSAIKTTFLLYKATVSAIGVG
jgi:hypothetical protein